jgi:hypothetical protein
MTQHCVILEGQRLTPQIKTQVSAKNHHAARCLCIETGMTAQEMKKAFAENLPV